MARIAEDTTNCPELRGRMYSELAQYLFPKRRATELPADESPGEIRGSKRACPVCRPTDICWRIGVMSSSEFHKLDAPRTALAHEGHCGYRKPHQHLNSWI